MKNRKKVETYKFNGVWGIKPVKSAELEVWITQYRAKLADPNDPDDKKWTARWLRRFERELAKKQDGLARKRVESAKRRAPANWEGRSATKRWLKK